MRKLNKKGFTLVEIMIVVAIIALLAAIAIPNLLRTRLNANEGAAIGNMHALVTALGSFQAAQSPPAYPTTLGALGSANPPYVDAVLAPPGMVGTKQGYTFTYTNASANVYTITASPVTANVTGIRGFFADQSGVIRVAAVAPATVADNPIQ